MAKKTVKFTNSAGDSFDLFPANPLEEQIIKEQLEAEWRAAGKTMPVLPTYEVTTVTGEKQNVTVHNREQAEAAGIMEAWNAYQQAESAFTEEYGTRFLTSCFLSVDADPDKCPRWKMRMKALGIAIPADDLEKFVLFCKTWVIRGKDDIPGLIFSVSRTMVNVSAEAQEAAEAKFRALLEEAANIQSPTA